MKVLILGGTQFVGRFITQEALQRNHHVTLFHRGRTHRGLFDHLANPAKEIYGDRNSELSKVDGDDWDAVIDVCNYFPSQSKLAAEYFRGKTKHFINISSMSVYNSEGAVGASENHEKLKLKEGADPEVDDNTTYGARKYLCELEVDKVFSQDQVLHLRPSVIVGPYDSTWRFAYWVDRFRRGGDIVLPNSPETPLCFVDVRALARFCIDGLEKKTSGAYNVLGPQENFTFGEFVEHLQKQFSEKIKLHWLPEQFLLDQKVQPWRDMPLWLPEKLYGMHRLSFAKATHQGLEQVALDKTISDTLLSIDRAEIQQQKGYGLTSEREDELISKA